MLCAFMTFRFLMVLLQPQVPNMKKKKIYIYIYIMIISSITKLVRLVEIEEFNHTN